MASAHRTYKEECSFIERIDDNSFLIKKGFVPNMKVGKLSFVLGEQISFKFKDLPDKICLVDSPTLATKF